MRRIGPTKRLSRTARAAAKALAKFNPKKTQERSYVLVGANGKPTKGKGVLVYVWRTRKGRLKFAPVKDGSLGLRRRDQYRRKVLTKKVARDKWYRRKVTHGSREGVARQRKGGELSYSVWTLELARELFQFTRNHPSKGTYKINLSFIVEVERGEFRNFVTYAIFKQNAGHELSVKDLQGIVKLSCYGALAEELKREHFVTSGSAAHIRSLSENKGVSRDGWVNRDGEDWGKGDFEVVKLRRISWTFERLAMV